MNLKDGLVVEELPDGGCLIVDSTGNQSHALLPEAAAVWRSVKGGRSGVVEIAAATKLERGLVEAALAELEAAGLLAAEAGGSSRREVLTRAATIAGAAVGLKLVETIATPSPAQAQSRVPV